MPHPVAKLLCLGQRGLKKAIASKNEKEMAQAIELIVRASTHKNADAFFKSLAGLDFSGKDPNIEDNDFSPMDPTDPDVNYGEDDVNNDVDPAEEQVDMQDEENVDEDSEAASPADEDLVNHDEDGDGVENDDDSAPYDSAKASIESNSRIRMATVARNLRLR